MGTGGGAPGKVRVIMPRGHIRRRGDKYYVVLELERDPDAPTKRRQRWVATTARTKKEAEQERTKLLREIDTGTSLEPSRMTVAEYLAHWLDTEASQRVRDTTLDNYRRLIRLHIAPFLGAKRIQALKPIDVAQFLGTVRSPSIAMNCRTVLSGACKTAVRWGWIATNPVRDVSPPRYRPAAGDAWSKEEVVAFLAATAGRPHHALYRMVLATGMRKGEAIDLRWSDLDLAAGTVTVARTAVWVGNVYHSHPPKSGEPRTITLDPETIATLRHHRVQQNEQRLRFGSGWRDEGRIFTAAAGGVIGKRGLSWSFDADLRRTGARRIRFHDMRHTHATILIEAGVDAKAVSQRLGHANIQITIDTYQHITPRGARDVADVVGTILAV